MCVPIVRYSHMGREATELPLCFLLFAHLCKHFLSTPEPKTRTLFSAKNVIRLLIFRAHVAKQEKQREQKVVSRRTCRFNRAVKY